MFAPSENSSRDVGEGQSAAGDTASGVNSDSDFSPGGSGSDEDTDSDTGVTGHGSGPRGVGRGAGLQHGAASPAPQGAGTGRRQRGRRRADVASPGGRHGNDDPGIRRQVPHLTDVEDDAGKIFYIL